ncbi:extracellular solute-binding protein [Kibdelosporangium philippinense]|uniref:extracellular solute-binding protein n=1 Tax=Kibdelosporangium philippinense TaxID=211113 RepID=UPI00360C931A
MRQWPYHGRSRTRPTVPRRSRASSTWLRCPRRRSPGAASLGGHNFAISAFAKNKATALDFIKYFTTDAAERSNLLATSQAPTRANLYDDPDWSNSSRTCRRSRKRSWHQAASEGRPVRRCHHRDPGSGVRGDHRSQGQRHSAEGTADQLQDLLK